MFFHGVEKTICDPVLQTNQHRLDAFEDMARLMKRDFDVLPLTALALSLGAPFWFDMLNKFINLRGAGDKPKREDQKP